MKTLLVLVIVLALPVAAFADAGVLRPHSWNGKVPDDALSISFMETRVDIDNGMADVAVLQIFESNSRLQLEGEYEFTIPEGTELSSFAIWEDGVRVPGVILEKQRARRIYDNLQSQLIDPGIVETTDEDDVNTFSCRVFPIPAFGSKRIELTYTQAIPVESEALSFYFPTQPERHQAQKVDHFKFTLNFSSDAPTDDPIFDSDILVPEVTQKTETGFTATFEAKQVELKENLRVRIPYPIDSPRIVFLTYRDVERVRRNLDPGSGTHFRDKTGFYGARLFFPKSRDAETATPKQVVLAMDTSLSMQWGRLDRAYEMVTTVLENLHEGDSFNLLTFNRTAKAMHPKTTPWSVAAAEKGVNFLRKSHIAGGTDLTTVFAAMADTFSGKGRKEAVLVTDGAATLGEINHEKIMAAFRKSGLAKKEVRLFVIGMGSQAGRTLLADLAAEGGGPFMQVLPMQNTQDKAKVLLDRLDAEAVEQVTMSLTGTSVIDGYPKLPAIGFGGESIDFIGRYNGEGNGTATVNYEVAGEKRSFSSDVSWPNQATDHEGLRRRWARARVDELLDMINREGETKEWIDEIISLSKEFTFVTPYTSFLAAPRSLLRPRVIRPGDPILRVKTDPAIRQVIASFPFGLTQDMRYLGDEDIWQLRFLAPPDWPDGSYRCTLYLTDVEGRRYVEQKEFVIDSRAPNLIPKDPGTLHAGTTIELVAGSDADTRRITAHIPGAGFCELRYDPQRIASTGRIELPPTLPSGQTVIEWFAEDFAHNVTRRATTVEVIGHE